VLALSDCCYLLIFCGFGGLCWVLIVFAIFLFFVVLVGCVGFNDFRDLLIFFCGLSGLCWCWWFGLSSYFLWFWWAVLVFVIVALF